MPPPPELLLEALACPELRVPRAGLLQVPRAGLFWHHTEAAASWCRWGLVRRTKPAREEHPAKSLGKREERETRRANEPYKRINTPSPTHTRSNLAAVCCKEFKGSSVLSLSSALGSAGEAAARIWAANANNTDVLTIRLFLQLKTKRSSKPKCEEMSALKNFSSARLLRHRGLQVCGGRSWVGAAPSGAEVGWGGSSSSLGPRRGSGRGMRAAKPSRDPRSSPRARMFAARLACGMLAAKLLGDCFYYCFNSFFNLVFLLAALSLTH